MGPIQSQSWGREVKCMLSTKPNEKQPSTRTPVTYLNDICTRLSRLPHNCIYPDPVTPLTPNFIHRRRRRRRRATDAERTCSMICVTLKDF
jgi:hypothetical protein